MIVIDKLRFNPKNPRKISNDEFELLKHKIRNFPQMLEKRPIVYDEGFIVLGGNQRLKAIRELKKEGFEIKDSYFMSAKGWTEEQKRQFVITDNISEGEWDNEILKKDWDDLPLEEWGIDKSEWKSEDVIEDEAPDVSKDPAISQLGEVYQLGRHRLMCGDSTKIEDVEKLMNGQKADMVFTDPPYGIDFQSNFREKTPQFEKIKNDDVVLEITPVIHSFMKDNAVAYICTRWDLYPQWYQQIQQTLNIKNCVVWYKRGGGLGDLASSYLPNHEFIIVAHKGNGELRGKRDADVWEIGRDGFNDYEHPTQKPVALSAFAINHHSDNDNIILDLFGGSGSTLIACEQTNRTCYMMELDPKYCDVIRKRYAKFIGKEAEWQTITPKI